MLSGLVGGLVGVTPAAGLVNPQGAMIIGLVSGIACYFGAVRLKQWLKYDDSLDAFGVHGVGGIVGALLTGLLADAAINGVAEGASLAKQALGLVAVAAWSAAGTGLILLICRFTTGLRVDREQEIEGLDSALHGESIH
jgi:Amt family ammonium transporter